MKSSPKPSAAQQLGRYSKVSRRIWNDQRFRRLSAAPPNGQTLFFRLLTAPELGTIPGIFSSGEAGLAEALGWGLEGFREAFAEVSAEGLAKADWEARLVFVPKALRHNKPESPNVIRSWRNTWDELPECSLKDEAYRALRVFAEEFGEAFLKAFDEACAQPSANQEQEQEQEQDQGESEPPEEHSKPEPVVPLTPRRVTNATDDGAFGAAVSAWCEGVRAATGGKPFVLTPGGNTRGVVEAIVAHCPDVAQRVPWARSKGEAWARQRREAGRELNPHNFIDWLNSEERSSGVRRVAGAEGPSDAERGAAERRAREAQERKGTGS